MTLHGIGLIPPSDLVPVEYARRRPTLLDWPCYAFLAFGYGCVCLVAAAITFVDERIARWTR